MRMPDIASLLAPLDDADPCGANLEYDADFLALDILAAPRGERGVGHAVRDAQEPEWRDVIRQALRLLERTRDLRVAMHLCTAWLKSDGPQSWVDGLALLRGLLEHHWDGVHPRIDDGDPVERVNAFAALCADDGTLGYLRHAPLIHLERVGTVTLRDLRIASGALKPSDDGMSVEALVERVEHVLMQAGDDTLRSLGDLATTALDHLDAITGVFAIHTPGRGPDVDALRRELREWRHALLSRLPGSVEEDVPVVQHDAPATSALNGAPGGHDDIRRQLDAICRWYERHEPSSPVAPLLRRARSLVGLDFSTLLGMLAPGGLAEFMHLTGEAGEY